MRCLATWLSPTGGSKSCQRVTSSSSQQGHSNGAKFLPAVRARVDVRQASNDGGSGGEKKQEKLPKQEFTEEDWEKIMGRKGKKYVRRPSTIHDYEEQSPELGPGNAKSLHLDHYSVADQEILLTDLRHYDTHPIGPWSWTPLEEIRRPADPVRQHGPTCSCELCLKAEENFQEATYLTDCEVQEEPVFTLESSPEPDPQTKFVFLPEPETKFVFPKTEPETTEAEQRNIWEEGLPSPPWLDETYHPKYAREIRLMYNRDHPWIKGQYKNDGDVKGGKELEDKTQDGVAALAAAEDSPRWLDSSYPPAYANEIRRLYQKQKAEKASGKK